MSDPGNAPAPDPEILSQELLQSGAEAELRLLKQERKAQRRLAAAQKMLAEDEAKMRRSQEKLARSQEAVVAAEAQLRECQARRATGPIPDQP